MGTRSALLISSSEYQDTFFSRLETPQNDVQALADVLRDPRIGNFTVETVINEPSHVVREAVEELFAEKKKDDLILLYFSGHGVKDLKGKLYLAMPNTKQNRLRATAVSAGYISDLMDECLSRRIVLILDCCHSGAFTSGFKGAVGTDAGIEAAFKGTGYGRVVLTASDAVQYAYEGDKVAGSPFCSVFTRFLVQGLRTGKADLSQDGNITADDLYKYAHDQIIQMESDKQQTPGRWSFIQGELVIARNPAFAPESSPTEPTSPGKRPTTYCLRPQVRHFVDRREIRAQLRADLRDEQKVIIVVDGLAGIGKTSLAAKIAEEVEADFTGIYWTKCSAETDLDQLLAELAYFLSEQGDQTLSGVVEYPAPAANKISFLLTALAEQKYLLVFDDLHELLDEQCQIANEGLRCLFSSLLDQTHRSKALLVSRVTPLFCRCFSCQSKNTLEDIDPKSSLELLQILGVEEDQELLEQARRLTAGHPLAMELLASLAEVMPLEDILEDRTLFFHDTDVVEHLLRHLSSTLTTEERDLLTKLSVLPRPMYRQVISYLVGNRQAPGLLKSLTRKALVIFDRKTKLYRQHDLVREFSRAGISADERRDCHVRMAAYYEQLEFNPEKPTFGQVQQRLEAHYHTFRAGDIAAAAALLAPIAEYLRKWGYLERCRSLLEDGLTALEQLEPTEEHLLLRVDLLVEMGWLERSCEGLDKAVERCRQAEEILQIVPDEGREGKVCHALGKFLYEEAEWGESEKYFERAVALQKSQRNTGELAKVLYDLYLLYWNVGELEKIEAVSRDGITICEQEGDTASKCRILIKVLGKTFQVQRRWEEALTVYEESLKSRKGDDFLGQSLSLRMMGQVLRQQKQFAVALEKGMESLALAKKFGDILAQARALQDIGDTYRDAGDVNNALQFYEKSIEATKQSDDLSGRSDMLSDIGLSFQRAGELEKTLEQFQEALRLRKRNGDILGTRASLGQLGFFYSTKCSELKTALQYYNDAFEIAKQLGIALKVETGQNDIAAVYKKLGKLDESLKLFEDLLRRRKKRKNGYGVPLVLNHIGDIYLLKGNARKGLSFFEESLRMYRERKRIGGASVSLSYLGKAYIALGEYDKALSALEESLALRELMYSKAIPLTAIAEAYYHKNDIDIAKEKCEESIFISKKYGGRNQTGIALHLLSKILLKKGQRDEALQCVREAVDIFRTSGSRYLPEAEKTLAEIEKK
ncbi:MAG: caspase, EACC1-associated type [Candidatus Electrothrix sp. YB6]